jgi:hypothetical protein
MSIDEEGTLARLKAVRKTLIDPTLARHRGRIFKTMGDGILVEFASAVDAVRGAVDIQRAMTKQNASVPKSQRIELRIGIHVGDIIIDENDVFGDGVNIAARLESIAETGGICVSGTAHDQVRDKLPFSFADLGDQTLKNIARPVRVYGIAAKEMIEPQELQKEAKLAKPVLVFVSGIRGQIGTTTVSKTLVDYWKANQLAFRIFDASGSKSNALGRFFPQDTRVVDLTVVDDQMAVFDTLADEPKITLVEIGSNQLIPTLQTLERIGFIGAVKSGSLDFKCLYVHDDKASDFADVREYFSDDHFYPVLNEFISQENIGEAEAQNGTANVVVTVLPRQAMATTEQESVSYLSFVANKLPNGENARYSFVLRGYVRHWLARIWADYDKIGIWKLPTASN